MKNIKIEGHKNIIGEVKFEGDYATIEYTSKLGIKSIFKTQTINIISVDGKEVE